MSVIEGSGEREFDYMPIRPICSPMVQNLESFVTRVSSTEDSGRLEESEALYIEYWAYKHNMTIDESFKSMLRLATFNYDELENVIWASDSDETTTIYLNSSYEITDITTETEDTPAPIA